MTTETWILGATGRTGRAVAERLHQTGQPLVLAGRDPARLRSLTSKLGDARVVSGSFDAQLSQIADAGPAVVVNTIGPFTHTSVPVVRACPPGTHYVDIANELPAVCAVLDGNDVAVVRASTVVTGAGFGVLATESVVLRVCEGRPPPTRLRVDALPSFALEEGVVGAALAGSILDGFPEGGRRVEHGRLVRSALAGDRQRLTTPDGDDLTTASLPSGDLIAAWRASMARSVTGASSEIPSGPAVRAVLPLLSVVLRSTALRRLAIRGLARTRMRAHERRRAHSWGHARAEWDDGTVREGWLRLDDAMDFTVAATAEVARRLADQEATPGAYTPAALFGASLATDLRGHFEC